MIVHAVDITEAGPEGLFGWLESHETPRSAGLEGSAGPTGLGCQARGCSSPASIVMSVHRRHSRRASEEAFFCRGHFSRHLEGLRVELAFESHR